MCPDTVEQRSCDRSWRVGNGFDEKLSPLHSEFVCRGAGIEAEVFPPPRTETGENFSQNNFILCTASRSLPEVRQATHYSGT